MGTKMRTIVVGRRRRERREGVERVEAGRADQGRRGCEGEWEWEVGGGVERGRRGSLGAMGRERVGRRRRKVGRKADMSTRCTMARWMLARCKML
jgi:hypothetical protein